MTERSPKYPKYPIPVTGQQVFLDRSRISKYPNKRLKPSDLGYGMTVCIAAIGDKGGENYIVTATDSMVAFSKALMADKLGWKRGVLARNWGVMFAGDISECSLVIEEIRSRTMPEPDGWRKSKFSARQLMKIATEGYRARLNQKIQNEILSPYGLTLGEINLQEQTDIRARIDWLISNEFECELLVYGFDPPDYAPIWEPKIFSVSNPGDVALRDTPSFWAIGSGADLALSSLAFSGQNRPNSTLEETLWNVCIAKFRAENAYGVGRDTELWITHPDNRSLHSVDEEVIDEARKYWQRLEELHIEVPRHISTWVKKMPKPDYEREDEE